jgi:uncharacterized protein
MPKNRNTFLNLFARSPISPLQAHMNEVDSCVQLLPNFFSAVCSQNWDEVNRVREAINQFEENADQLKMDFRTKLPAHLLLPVPRLDLLQLIETQDKMANLTKDISGIVLGRKMVIPEQITSLFNDYLTITCKAAHSAKRAIDDLDVLLESGFKGKASALVDQMIQTLNEAEHLSDDQQILLRQAVFDIEAELSPIDAMFLYKILQWLGDISDKAQHIGTRLKMMVGS